MKKLKPKERNPAHRAPSGPAMRGLMSLALLALAAIVWAQGREGITVDLSSYFWTSIVGILGTILVNSVFVAGEVAIEQLRPGHVRALERDDEPRAKTLEDFMAHKGRYAAACFLGSQTMRFWMILLCVVPAPTLASALQERGMTVGGALLLAFVIISVPVAAVNVVLGELIPKSFAASHPVATILRLRTIIRLFAAIFSPFSLVLIGAANLVTKRFGSKASFVVTNQAEEEIKQIVETAQQAGEMEEGEKQLLHSVFEFSDTVVREIMTPRVDIDAVPVVTEPEEVFRLIQDSGHSRIPVYEETDDQIIGIIHAKDLLTEMLGDREFSLRQLMRPAHFVPENKNLHELLKELRASRSQMAIVQDEFGGTAGIVTIEDIVEELVGDIVDEYDVEEAKVVLNGKGYLVDGKVNLYDLNNEIGSHFESDVFDTVGGYVFGLFGRQPHQGEIFEADGYRFTVEETDGRRIHRLHLEPLEQEAEGVEQVASV